MSIAQRAASRHGGAGYEARSSLPTAARLPGSGLAGTEPDTIDVLILAQGTLTRSGIAAMVSCRAGIRVLGDGEDVASVPAGRRLRPHVVVLCLADGSRSAFEKLRNAREAFGASAILLVMGALSSGGTQRALEANVAGVISDDASADELVEAIRRLSRGQRIVGADVAVMSSARTANPLTPRESELLGLAAEGESPEESAGHLHLSVGTVRNHLLSAVQKTGARNRLDAVRIARARGWL
ncbi:two-component system, NarL family, response regulator DesR [Streptomyces sp. 2224.1]|nr:two-component system, NarL family, response regulator DesR [Streptomyces sp. 2224.1]